MTFTPADLIWLVAIFVLLLMSGFFSGSETALTATSRARMHQLERDGVPAARRVIRLTEDREGLIGAILLGNNLVNILATALATALFSRLFGPLGVAYATAVMTALILIFAEVTPKTYAITNSDRMAMAVSGPITWLVLLLGPVVRAVTTIVRGVLRVFGLNAEGDVLSAHEEIRGAIELHHSEGGVEGHDRQMLGGILDLRELTIGDVMIHRKNMEMIDLADTGSEIVDQVLASRYTRLPVWIDDPDNIIGVLHSKDLLRALKESASNFDAIDIRTLAREPWFVPETTPLVPQLNAFRAKREHFALVVDEFGALMGLCTLEDILEEIVGEIDDEFDQPVEGLQELADGALLLDGSVTIRDLNRAKDWTLPDDEAVTVAGLVIHEAQTIPERGQVFSFYGRRFEIVERQRNQLTKLKVSVVPEDAGG